MLALDQELSIWNTSQAQPPDNTGLHLNSEFYAHERSSPHGPLPRQGINNNNHLMFTPV